MKILGLAAGLVAAALVAWLAVSRARPQPPAPMIEKSDAAAAPAPVPVPASDVALAAAAPAPGESPREPAPGAAPSPAAEIEHAACTVALKGSSPVALACREGGRRAAKKLMKEIVNAAQKNGTRKTCDGCHVDLDSYALLTDARPELDSLLHAAGR